jgi:uncharacterized membrane protein YeaQ/YmgE (transglycosylase-associated protein family)
MTPHNIFWYVLVGWVAGWVTGRAIKGSGLGAVGDVLLGIAGGLGGGWLMRHSYQHDNWGHLLALTVAAACGSLLTWLFRRVIQRQRWQPRQTDLTEEHIANGHA